VDDVVPAVDVEDPEDGPADGLVVGERGLVEETDDPGDDGRRAEHDA